MPESNLIEILIRANSAEAAAQVNQVRAALNGLGDSVSIVARQVAPAETAVRTLGLSSQQTATVVRAVNSALGTITPGQLPAVEAAVKGLGMSAEQTAVAMRRLNVSNVNLSGLTTQMEQLGLTAAQSETVLGTVQRTLSTLTPGQIPAIIASLRQLGLSEEELTSINMRLGGSVGFMTQLSGGMDRALFRSIGALSLIGAAAMTARRAMEALVQYYRDGIQYTMQFEQETHQLAIELSSLSQGRGVGYAQDLEYATIANEQLRTSVLSLGGNITMAQRLFHEFVAAGVVPDTQRSIESVAKLQLILSTMVTSRRPEFMIMQELQQLLAGEITKQNQIAQILERKLHLSDQQLLNWVRQGIEADNLGDKLSTALDPGTKAMQEWQNLLPQLQQRNKDLADEIKRAGMSQAYSDAVRAAKEYNEYLTSHKESLIEAHRNIAEGIGRIELAYHRATVAATEFFGHLFSLSASQQFEFSYAGRRPVPGVPTVAGTGGALAEPIPEGGLMRYLSGGTTLPAHDQPVPSTRTPGWGQGRGGGGRGGSEAFVVARDLIAEAAQHATSLADRIQDAAQREAALAAIHQQEAQQYLQLAARTHDAAKAAELRLRAESLITQAINEQRQAARDSANEAKQAVEAHVRASEDFLAHVKAMGVSGAADQLAGLQRVQQYLTGVIQKGQAPGATAPQQVAAQAALDAQKRIDEQVYSQRQAINRQIEAANKASLDEQLKAVQDHMSDLEAAGQLNYQTKIALIQQEIVLVQNAEDQKLIIKKDAIDKIAALDRELASAFAENQRQQAAASKQLASEMERDYKQLMAPIDSATKAVANSISNSFKTAFDDIIFGAKKGHSAILDLFQGIGKSIINEVTTMLARGVTASLNIEPMLQGLFGPLNRLAGGVGSPQEAMMRAEQMAHAAATTQYTSATVFQHAVAIFQTAVAKMTGTAPTRAAPSGPTGPFTNIPGVPAATGGLLTGGPSGDIGTLGGMIPGPIGSYVRTAASLWGTLSSLIGTGASGSLILRGGGGLVPGPLIPLAAAAEGGIFSRPTLALVAERGEREMVVPESKWGRAFGRGDGGGDTHIYMISAVDVASFEDRIAQSHRTIARSWARGLGLNSPNLRGVRSG